MAEKEARRNHRLNHGPSGVSVPEGRIRLSCSAVEIVPPDVMGDHAGSIVPQNRDEGSQRPKLKGSPPCPG
jgi:hypothetical protein